jgi:hypothetical protein
VSGQAARTPAAARCPSLARLALASVVLLAGVYRGFIWPRFRRWGAADEELAGPFPGADLISGGTRGGTMAVTIDAPPAAVWPWLVQMGCDRAGWYSWDRLDNGGRLSADRIHSEWQQVAVGDRWLSMPSGRSWFEVAALDPERFLGLRAPLRLDGRPFDPARAETAVLQRLVVGVRPERAAGTPHSPARQWICRVQPSGTDDDRRPAVLGAGALDHAAPTAG